MTKARLRISDARALALTVKAILEPGCSRIEVAGSIRRECEYVGDLEIVAIPRSPTDLIGEPVGTRLDPILSRLMDDGRLERIKGGDRYKQFLLVKVGVHLDLFLATAETWGCIYTIRTGSAEFARRLVTQKGKGGLCPNDLRFDQGRLWKNGNPVATPEEEDVFRALGLRWVEPTGRK